MAKRIFITIVLLASLVFCFSQTVAAEKRETFNGSTNVMYVNRSDSQLEKKVYTQAEIETEKKKRRQWQEKNLKKEQQKLEAAKFATAEDLGAIKAVNIVAQTATFNAVEDSFGNFILMGEVKNTGTTTAQYVTINVNLYDAGNNLLAADFSYIDGGSVVQLSSPGFYTNALKAGDIGFFRLYSFTEYANVDHYTYSFDYSAYPCTSAKATLKLSGSPFMTNYVDNLRIIGNIKNTGCCYLTYFTEVYFAIYNAAGKVIDVNWAYVEGSNYKFNELMTTSTAIAPGATEGFSLNTQAPYSSYSSYKYAFQWDEAQVYTLTVQSSPGTGANITVSPSDNNENGNGYTNFTRTYGPGKSVAITAPSSLNGGAFIKWTVDGTANTSRTINVTMNSNHTVVAVFGTPTVTTYTLTVQSSGVSDAAITVSPADQTGSSDGTTSFTRTYLANKSVTLTAPSMSRANYFAKWTIAGSDTISRTVTITMNKNITAVANYTNFPPIISLNRSALYFTYVEGGSTPAPQTFIITNDGNGTLDWWVNNYYDAISCSPVIGNSNGAIITVSMDPAGYDVGSYYGILDIVSNGATNSPQHLAVYLEVIKAEQNQAPIGDFSTPLDDSTVSSSVAVTGWAVDDTGVNSVKIYYENGNSLGYIGDAVFVDGARSDIQQAYPTYPGSYKAGWGYMLLTNFLPNGDNTYKLHAIAADSEGKTTDLGARTITVDNTHAVKPFGAIDTPAQGGTASGAKFSNVGWILTPHPNNIATNGSTINVYIDGVNKGHPTYNIYRSDIAGFFPGYANSNGSMARFYIDTTAYETGYHSIFWIATDNAGNADGIGSRFFTIENIDSSSSQFTKSAQVERLKPVPADRPSFGDFVSNREQKSYADIPADCVTPIEVKKGFARRAIFQNVLPDENGISHIDIKENEVMEIDLSRLMGKGSRIAGYLVTGSELKALPLGSTLDRKNGKFYWLPVAGFMGDYKLAFIVESKSGIIRKDIQVTISP
ncbi:MAG: hypothetical protein QG657_2399 [Acidobacteriota bacterium]|nr:hypothetical protein [Acidobacteriota bacterium]